MTAAKRQRLRESIKCAAIKAVGDVVLCGGSPSSQNDWDSDTERWSGPEVAKDCRTAYRALKAMIEGWEWGNG